jgi:hypothetical protein
MALTNTARNTEISALSGDQRNAYTAVQQMLKEFGLESLAPKILGYVKEGFSSDTIAVQLQETAEWKRRFAANEARVKKGLPVLPPQEYIQTERAYRQIMQSAGVPAGFYDSQSDFERFLSDDVAPQEVQSRVQAATEFVNRANPQELAFMKSRYTTGDLIAFALDPDRAAPLVGKAFQAATIGGQASAQGLQIGRDLAEGLAADGVSREAAMQGFSIIAGEQPNANKLAAISGTDGFTTEDLVQETFRSDSVVAQRRQKLASQERGRFSGSSGVGQGSLGKTSGGL